MRHSFILAFLLPLALSAPLPQEMMEIETAAADLSTVINKCPYSLFVRVAGGGTESSTEEIKPGCKWQQGVKILPSGGVSIKLGKEANNDVITQFEYTAQTESLWYNISFVDCFKRGGVAACPGLDGGVKLVSASGCRKFICPKGQKCEDNAYFIEENGYKDNAPVTSCRPHGGVTMTMCSEM